MGVLNVTPDSFSDGGLFFDPDTAAGHGHRLSEQGAEIIDVGGESTRPGAQPVPVAEELRRVVPVIERLSAELPQTEVSIDTRKAAVAEAALKAGAQIVNDVSALRSDGRMVELIAGSGAQCCLMHMRGEPDTMQDDPRYEDVVDDVKAFLEERMAFAVSCGVSEQNIMLDPGIGFGKTVEHNLTLLRRLNELTDLGRPIVIGTSRKSFIGRVLGDQASPSPSPDDTGRQAGTLATCVLALERGASIFRVHDVSQAQAALRTAAATLSGSWTHPSPTSKTRG